MNKVASELLDTINQLIILMELNCKTVKKKIDRNEGMSCKKLSYSRSLYDGILKGSSHIVKCLLQDEPDLYSIKRYYLKPMLEDYVNLFNIHKFGEEYVRAMQVHFMSEDYDIDAKYRTDYSTLGVTFNKNQEESKKHIIDKIGRHFGNLSPDLSEKFFQSGERKHLPISSRIYISKMPVSYSLSMKAFYDYSNIHHHLDLRFSWLTNEDDSKFIFILIKKLDEYLVYSTKMFSEIFDI